MEILWNSARFFCEQKIHSHIRGRLNNKGTVRHLTRRRVLTRLLPVCKYYLRNLERFPWRTTFPACDVLRHSHSFPISRRGFLTLFICARVHSQANGLFTRGEIDVCTHSERDALEMIGINNNISFSCFIVGPYVCL